MHYLYPLFYKASDLFVPVLEKEELKFTTDKDGNQEILVSRKRLDGVPTCRIEHTEIQVPVESCYLQISKCSDASSVTEKVSGVTASRRPVTWDLGPTEYSVESLLSKDYTNVFPGAVLEMRNFFTAQKGMFTHDIKFSTGFKGWFGIQFEDGTKVFPAGYIAEDRVVLAPGLPPITTNGSKVVELTTAGCARKWRKIMATVLKNSSFAAVLGFGISGLLMPFVKGAGEPGFLNLYGDSGAGKTTLLQLLSSAITAPFSPGDPGSYLMSFRVTENGFEGPLSGRNNSMMLFDEVGAADTQINWSSMVYMGANGVGKGRMNHDSSMRAVKRWSTQIIGTGEASITSKMGAKNQAIRGGILFRLVEIGVESVPYFEHLSEQVQGDSLGEYQAICDEYLPNAKTTSDVMQAIMRGAIANHGHAWWDMATALLNQDAREKFITQYSQWKSHFTSKLSGRDEKIVHRRSTHLASSLTGLQMLLSTMHDELDEIERESIVSGAADWVEKYMWRAGLPDGKYTEKADAVERLLEKISTNPDRFYKFGEDFPSKNFNGFWGMVKNDRVFLFKSGLEAVCHELDEDPKRLRTALIGLSDSDRWTPNQERPGGKKNGIHGLWAPIGFAVLG